MKVKNPEAPAVAREAQEELGPINFWFAPELLRRRTSASRTPRAALAVAVEPHKAPIDTGVGVASGVDGSSALLVQSAFSQRAAASALSSGRVLNAIAAAGAALCTALITASNIDRLWGGRRMPAPITTQS